MEDELSRVVDTLPGLIWTAQPDGRADFLNRHWRDYTGLDIDEGYGRAWQAAVHPDDLAGLLEHWRPILESGQPGEAEARLLRADGEYRWFQFRTQPLRDEAGQVLKWCGVNTDIEDRKRAEAALRESDRRFRLIVDGLPAVIHLMTADGEFTHANTYMLDYFGVTLEEFRRQSAEFNYRFAFHRDDRDEAMARWQESVRTGTPYDHETRLRRHDGVYRWFHTLGFPLRDATGEIVLWYLWQEDIDDRKRAEALLAGEKQLLEMVARGRPIPDVLDALCRFVESIVEGCYCSVVLVDEAGERLEHGAAPSLPASFIDAIVGRPVNAESGPCAMAAHLNERVVADDLASEIRWADHAWCPMAMAHGLRACLSTPIPSSAGKVLGALAVYFDASGAQGALDQDMIEQFTHLASIAIERAQNDAALKRGEALLAGEKQLLEMVASGRPLPEVLRQLCLIFEGLARDCTCSVVLVDAAGTALRQGASPSVPAGFMDSVDGRLVGIDYGPCATAAFLNEPVISPDVNLESRWQDYGWPALALAHGMQAVWSTPIGARSGKVIGSFALHYRAPTTPTAHHQNLIDRFTHLASIVIERAQDDAALKHSEEGFRAIVETTPECVKVIARDGTLLSLNSAGVTMAGAGAAEDVIGRNFYDFVAPEDRDRYRAFNETICSEAGERGFLEFDIVGMSGERRQMETHAAPMRHENGSLVQLGVTRDITARKQAEEELRRSEAYLTEAQKLSLTGSFGWRVSTDEHFWSAETFRVFGFDPSTRMTLPLILDRVHPDDAAVVRQVIGLAAEGQNLDSEFRLLMPDGTAKHVHVVGHNVEGMDGSIEYIGAIQDVTQGRLSEEALGKVRSELARVARITSLGALTASIAHEVNQPLSGIITNASTCLRMLAADPPNIAGALETARRTIRDGNRASDVITRLRALFGKKGLPPEKVDMNEAVREVIALASGDLQRNRVLLRAELASDLPPVTGDRIQLQQVVLNLLLNASDAMRDVEGRPRQIVVRSDRDDGEHVRVSVRDTGAGFEPQSAAQLFDAFYTTKSDGMGMGLSISRSIVESHEGRLWAMPNDGPGATFAFSIPSGPAAVAGATGPDMTIAEPV